MTTPTNPQRPTVRQEDEAIVSESWRILKEALDDDAFDGAELATFGAYTVSWDTIKGLVAIADRGGWWVMGTEELKAIAAATPSVGTNDTSPSCPVSESGAALKPEQRSQRR